MHALVFASEEEGPGKARRWPSRRREQGTWTASTHSTVSRLHCKCIWGKHFPSMLDSLCWCDTQAFPVYCPCMVAGCAIVHKCAQLMCLPTDPHVVAAAFVLPSQMNTEWTHVVHVVGFSVFHPGFWAVSSLKYVRV